MSTGVKTGPKESIEDFLIEAKNAMNAMQSKFGAVNAMQGELKVFREELKTAIDSLTSTCKTSTTTISKLKDVDEVLSANLDEIFEKLPLLLNKMATNIDADSNHLKALAQEATNLSAIVEQRLRVHRNWKYISAVAITVLLVIVITGGYEINQLNSRFAALQNQVASQVSILNMDLAENQKGIGEVKNLIDPKDKKGNKGSKAKGQDKGKKEANDQDKR